MLFEEVFQRNISKVFYTTFLILCPHALWAQSENVFMLDDAVRVEHGAQEGFRLLSSNTEFPVVLAYGDEDQFPTDNLPPHISAWLEGYQEMLATYKNSPGRVTAWLEASKTNAPAIEPLLGDMEWGQDYPYNLFCPKVDSKQCPSGCVATALSQIMRYHQWPLNGAGGVKVYQTRTHHIPVTFDFSTTTFQWDRMYDHYDSDSTDVEPVAMLLQAVGAAVEMDYTPKGSGSFDQIALQGVTAYLGYDHDMYVAEPDAYTDEQWHRLLQQELQDGRPVYYSGNAPEGGHAFVIDGMRNNNNGLTYYHVNWGWDGLCNGYYLLNMLRPSQAGTGGTSGTNYGTQPTMFIGMKPDDGISQPNYVHCKSLDLHSDKLFAGQNLSMRLSRLILRGNADFKGCMKVIMSSMENTDALPRVIYEEKMRNIKRERGLTNYYMPALLPSETQPGMYQIEMVLEEENGKEVYIDIDQWPQLAVRDDVSWIGGSKMMSRQYVAAKGNRLDLGNSNQGMVCFTIDSLCNISSASVTGGLSLIVCATDSSLIASLEGQTNLNIGGYSIIRGNAVSGILSRNMPDGNYLLGIGFLPIGSKQWSFVYEMTADDDILWCGNEPLFRTMSVKDGRITIGSITFEGADTPWTSSIHEVAAENDSEGVYCLDGCYMGAMSNQRIPRGVYMKKINGKWKKVVI